MCQIVSYRRAGLYALAVVTIGACGPPESGAAETMPPIQNAASAIVPMGTAAPVTVAQLPRLLGPLSPRRIFGDSTDFAKITSVRPVGRYLLVTDQFTSPHNSILDRRTGRIIRRFGRDGRGPREFRDARWSLPLGDTSSRAWIYDFKNRRFSLLDLDKPEPEMVLEQMDLNVVGDLERPVWIGQRILSNGLFSDFSVALLSREGRLVSRIAVSPPFSARDMPHAVGRFHLNRNYLAAHPSGSRVALVYQNTSRVDVLNGAGQLVRSIRGPRAVTPKYRVQADRFFWEDDTEMAYHGAEATARYVYALFCGCRDDEERPSSRLHVFSWAGQLIAEIEIDRPLRAIGVTNDDSILYGAFEAPYPQIGEWLLPAGLRDGT